MFRKRGYIEGFYGETWERNCRISVMELMASYGMNTFYYAPKDDIYHREKWREPYPEKELSELKELYEKASENAGKASECVGCGQCEAICPQHIHIIDELKHVAELFE